MARNTVEIRIIGDADSAVRAFRQVDDAGATTQSRFKSVTGGISEGARVAFAGVGVAAVGSFGVSMFKLGADLQQLDSKARTVFGDQIGVVDKWAKSSANAMGLTAREARGLAANMADLLIPMEFTRAQATQMSTDVIGLSGALSAWSGGTRSASEVSDILTSAMLGERDALKGLGISINQAEIDTYLLEHGQKNLTGTALQQAQAQATVALIMAKSTDAQRAFADSTVSTNEKLAVQGAKFRELQEKVGGFVHGGLESYAAWALSPSGGAAVTGFWRDYNAGIDRIVITTQKVIDKFRTFADLYNRFNPTSVVGNAIASFIPKFHSGGVVPGPVGSEQLAMLQGGETVLPIGAQGGGSVTTNYFSFPNYVGNKDDLADAINEMFSRGGAFTNGRGGTLAPA